MTVLLNFLVALAFAFLKAVVARQDLIAKVTDEGNQALLKRFATSDNLIAGRDSLRVREPALHLEQGPATGLSGLPSSSDDRAMSHERRNKSD